MQSNCITHSYTNQKLMQHYQDKPTMPPPILNYMLIKSDKDQQTKSPHILNHMLLKPYQDKQAIQYLHKNEQFIDKSQCSQTQEV